MDAVEVYRPVIGFGNGLYEISNFGNLKSLGNSKSRKEKTIKPGINSRGYMQVTLNVCGIKKNYSIHKLVAMAFLGHTPNGHSLVIDHIDGNKLNNNTNNLRIVTNRENTSVCFRKNSDRLSSIFAGVHFSNSLNLWVSSILFDGNRYLLKTGACEVDMHDIYIKAVESINNGTFNEYYLSIRPEFSSPYIGVFFDKKYNKFEARITLNGRQYFLGRFKNDLDASILYNKAKANIDKGTFEEFFYSIKQKTSSKYKGVSWNKRDKRWQANIQINGVGKFLGTYGNELDAKTIYDKVLEFSLTDECANEEILKNKIKEIKESL